MKLEDEVKQLERDIGWAISQIKVAQFVQSQGLLREIVNDDMLTNLNNSLSEKSKRYYKLTGRNYQDWQEENKD